MTTRLLQLWRAACAALGFAATGAIALALAFVVLPLDRRIRGGPHDLHSQRWVHRGSRLALWIYRGLGILRVRVHGAERLVGRGPRLLVANHPTLFDFVLLSALLPQLDCVVKPSWARNFFLRGLVRACGYPHWESPRRVLRDCRRRLEAGRSLLIFPEGTRSPRGGLGPFHRGAAHLALATGAPLVPVLIRCEPPIISGSQKWYDLGTQTAIVTLRVRDRIRPEVFSGTGMAPSEATRRLNDELREVFAKGLDLAHTGT